MNFIISLEILTKLLIVIYNLYFISLFIKKSQKKIIKFFMGKDICEIDRFPKLKLLDLK